MAKSKSDISLNDLKAMLPHEGSPAEQVAALVSHEPSDRTGIGIKNVNDRLKIYFGEAYGLTIESEPDVGTCVTVRMPKLTGGQNDAASV